jgi:cyclic lactone autoinducer peptide
MKKHSFIALAATLFTLIASLVASSACFWGMYQPQEPKSLQDK